MNSKFLNFNVYFIYFYDFLQCVQIQYGYNLKKWPSLWTLIEGTGEDPNKKPSFYFKNGQLERYLEEIDMNDCYMLVRATVAVLIHFNQRILDMKLHMKWKGIYLVIIL